MTSAALGARSNTSIKDAARASVSADWRAAAIAMLSVRLIQGFVYWGGGSRRFIYAPSKLDPNAPSWMANKLQSAMPGALLGTDQVVAYLMGHFWLLYTSIVIFSAVELIVGLALMAGFLTRLAALASLGLSVSLMLLFGWQGGTCIDEWTMASCNVAIAATLMLAGSAAWSVDAWLLRRNPLLAKSAWFRWGGGALKVPLGEAGYRRLAFALLAFVLAFDLGLYNYYRGSIVTPYHKGPVGAEAHSYGLADATRLADGGVRFSIALDGGTPAVPGHVMAVEVLDAAGRAVASWDWRALAALAPTAIVNDFPYNRFKAGTFGLEAGMGAKAVVTLPPSPGGLPADGATLRVTDVDGQTFSAGLKPS
jgi:thiosulfate dehydrogenase [quinone] large subunit